jgi:hypothetical protein
MGKLVVIVVVVVQGIQVPQEHTIMKQDHQVCPRLLIGMDWHSLGG